MKLKALFMAAVLIMMTGCASNVDPGKARERYLARAGGEIIVGVAWPLADRNDGFKEGLELALEEINERGVLGTKLSLVLEDDRSSLTTGLSIAQNFAANEQLSAVIGHRSSNITVPASKIYDNAGLLLIAPISTAPNLTGEEMDMVIRMLPSDIQIGEKMADYAQSRSYRNIVIFYADDEYGRGLANSFEDHFASSGGLIVDRVSDYKDAHDLKRLIDKWRLLDYDALFLAESAGSGAQLIRDLRAAGMDKPVLGGDALDADSFVREGGQATEGAVVASIFDPTDTRSVVTDFIDRYRSKYNEQPSKWAAQAYDSLTLLAASIEQAGSRSPADIATTMKKMPSWSGISGERAYDRYGNPEQMPIVLKLVRSGKFEYLN